MTWHILPIDDLKEHQELSTCECQPKVLHENGNMVIVHNSFDGREAVEWANEVFEMGRCYKTNKLCNCSGLCRDSY